ncbi:unnamed protein product [Rotaria sp. Silwood2]|nr:unnamed protein product [Rotaria sp. Silwood2]CAF2704991.1 unnamed protein product [Rotaria sp. Silwood2]CAF4354216.1 unnamed protein product [Rotaria sp. Silwood2]
MLCSILIYSLLFIHAFLNVQGYNYDTEFQLKNLVLRRLARSTCPSSTQCLSKWGYCGTGPDFCGDGCQAGPCTKPGGTSGGGSACPNPSECKSKWGYCGTGPDFCGDGCQAGPCTTPGGSGGGGSVGVIDSSTFACVFNTIDPTLRANRFSGLQATGWTPANKDEAAVFLAHVCHETGGLRTMREDCAPGCGSQYSGSWCSISGAAGKLYYGRGWLQLSWPCNYYNAGQSLGVDLLGDPDKVENDPKLAVSTALWFYKANGMAAPAQRGDFAATTRIINGPLECDNGSGYSNQLARVATYKRVRQCFNLGEPSINPVC